MQLLGLAFVLGVVLSLIVGVARLADQAWVRGAALAFVEFARGISSIVLVFIMAIAIPVLLGWDQRSIVVLGAIALGINMGATARRSSAARSCRCLAVRRRPPSR